MNETTYNLAMFGKEYLDKAIEGVKTASPKVMWYLQWKCNIFAIEYGMLLLFTIFTGYGVYKLVDKIKKLDVVDEESVLVGVTVTLLFILLILISSS